MSDKQGTNRREFIGQLATAAGAVVLVPAVTACDPKPSEPAARRTTPRDTPPRPRPDEKSPMSIPQTKPAGWDPMAYNLKRGEAGAIPAAYMKDIKAEGGDKNHLGKHLPYVPKVDAKMIPGGYLAIMWGDTAKGHARHPNDPPDPARKYIGHWYDWIKIRKADAAAVEELKNDYPHWPGKPDAAKKHYAVFGGGDITGDKGKNTIYLVKLPKDVKAGDTVRIWAHCLHHGEYVDFVTV